MKKIIGHVSGEKKRNIVKVGALEKSKYIKELDLDKKKLKEFAKRKKSKKKKKEEDVGKKFETYKTNFYSKLSNFFMGNISSYFIKRFEPNLKKLAEALIASNIHVLFRTYVGMILFSSIVAFPITLIISFLLTMNILLAFIISILFSGIVFVIMYSYPFMIANERKAKIDQELVFAIVHMSAVAGSGAHPVKIFQLIVDSKEYDELSVEFKRVLNYLNLFGYSLSNALRIVANTTPSAELKELFQGMISSIETGGDIREYLSRKADDILTKYRFSQKKYLESIATYSEIYTGFLITGPLLFVVTLAILEKVSPEIAGISVGMVATLGTFVLLPLLNILFMLFLETSKSEAV